MVDPLLWQATLDALQLQMTRATFDTWLRGSRLVEVSASGDVWTVGVGHAYALDWLQHRLQPLIERTAERVAGRPIEVRFVVRPLSGARPALDTPSSAGDDARPFGRALDAGELVETVRQEHVVARGDGSALVWTDFYIKLKVAFRRQALRRLRGAKLAVWLCLALHVDRDGVSSPGIGQIMEETGYNSRSTVCSALDDLVRLRLVEKLPPNRWGNDRYRLAGYAWFGQSPAPALFELEEDAPDGAG